MAKANRIAVAIGSIGNRINGVERGSVSCRRAAWGNRRAEYKIILLYNERAAALQNKYNRR